jgi:hypothetical protein
MSHRRLALVSGLTLGDYLLWNWSLNGNHDVLALLSGLTLPLLALACIWLLAVSLARIVSSSARRSKLRPARLRGAAQGQKHRAGWPSTAADLLPRAGQSSTTVGPTDQTGGSTTTVPLPDHPAARARSSPSSSGKRAA